MSCKKFNPFSLLSLKAQKEFIQNISLDEQEKVLQKGIAYMENERSQLFEKLMQTILNSQAAEAVEENTNKLTKDWEDIYFKSYTLLYPKYVQSSAPEDCSLEINFYKDGLFNVTKEVLPVSIYSKEEEAYFKQIFSNTCFTLNFRTIGQEDSFYADADIVGKKRTSVDDLLADIQFVKTAIRDFIARFGNYETRPLLLNYKETPVQLCYYIWRDPNHIIKKTHGTEREEAWKDWTSELDNAITFGNNCPVELHLAIFGAKKGSTIIDAEQLEKMKTRIMSVDWLKENKFETYIGFLEFAKMKEAIARDGYVVYQNDVMENKSQKHLYEY